MSIEPWQLHLLDALKGQKRLPELYPHVDAILTCLAKFDSHCNAFDQQCVDLSGSDAHAKKQILRLIDELLLRDERDIVRIFGKSAFADHSKKQLKRRYQRLTRLFHPDLGMEEVNWLNAKMSLINRSYELALDNFANPFDVDKAGVAEFSAYAHSKQQRKRKRKRYTEDLDDTTQAATSIEAEQEFLSNAMRFFSVSVVAWLRRRVYQIERLYRQKGIQYRFKWLLRSVVLLLLITSAFMLLISFKTNRIDNESEFQSTAFEQHKDQSSTLQDEQNIDDLLNRLLDENSTRDTVREALTTSQKNTFDEKSESILNSLSARDNTPENAEWVMPPSKPHSGKKQRSNNIGPMPVSQTLPVSSLDVNNRFWGVPQEVKLRLVALELSFATQDGSAFAQNFTSNARYFNDQGRRLIAESRDHFFAGVLKPQIRFSIAKTQHARSEVSVSGSMKMSFNGIKNGQAVEQCTPLLITFLRRHDKYLVSSMQRLPQKNSFCEN